MSRRLALGARIVEADVARGGMVKFRGADGLLGSRRPAPSLFTMPGLHSQPVWGGVEDVAARGHTDLAESIRALEEASSTVSAEFAAAREASNGRDDYNDEHTLHGGAEWNWLSMLSKGDRQILPSAPVTSQLVKQVPRLMTGVPFGFAFFSSLKAGGVIAPHAGPMNLRLRVHLPLSVPLGDVGMRVGATHLKWQEHKAIFFDDTYVHEVWNRTEADRLILLLDVWHPDLHDDEIEAIKSMFQKAQAEKQQQAP